MGIFTATSGADDDRAREGAKKKKKTSAAQNAYHQAKSRDERDIATKFKWGPADPERREACRLDLRLFLETYFPGTFRHPFSPTHLKLIELTQKAILNGGLHCCSFFRGGGKTSVLARAVLWAIAYGHRRYAVIVGATEELAGKLMTKHIRSELTKKELLAADFPELCSPFQALEGHGRKCAGQVFNGEATGIQWSNSELKVAAFKWSIERGNAGSVMLVKSITGAMKGQTDTAPILVPGDPEPTVLIETIRPDILLLDDIQTRESANSPVSTKKRVQTVQGDALGLAGHDRKIAAIQAVTKICENDLACQFLDRDRMPEWRGETTRMVITMPEKEELWDEYRAILHDAMRTDGDENAAARFYVERREEMDRGAVMAWPERIPEGYVSALQYAMELKFRDPEAFAAEYQNDPLSSQLSAGLMLPRDEIARKVNGLKRGMVPQETEWLTCFLDVNDAYLYYAVCAWQKDFTGACLEYGAWPEQNKRYHTKADANPTLAAYLAKQEKALAGSPIKTLLAAGLDESVPWLLGLTWKDDQNQVYAIKRLLIDTRYEKDVVSGAIERLKQKAEKTPIVMPSMGVGYGAKQKPMAEIAKKAGDLTGCHWRAAQPDAGKHRTVTIDTNYWKTTLHEQLAVPLGVSGCFSVYGTPRADHSMFADHLTAELGHRVTNETKGEERRVVEWTLKPNRENETLDAVVGCFVGASMLGSELTGAGRTTKPSKRKADWSQYAKL
jgi:hypothetical protein